MRPIVPLSAALVGLLLLAAAEQGLAPPTIALADAPRHEGARVAVEAWVAEVRDGERGAALVLADRTARLPALVSGDPPAARGATVRAVGVVARDGDGFVLSAERVREMESPAALPVAAALDAAADGRRVVVEGVHLRGALRDGDDGLPLRFADAPAPEGPLVVSGVLRLDRARAQFVLEAEAWTRA